MPDIANGSGDHPSSELRGVLAHPGETLRSLVLVVEIRKVLAILAGDRGAESGGVVNALLETGNPLQHIPRPADRLAEFPVADDVNAGLRLPIDHLGDRASKALLVGRRIIRLVILLFPEEGNELRGTNQAAHMRRQNPTCRPHVHLLERVACASYQE